MKNNIFKKLVETFKKNYDNSIGSSDTSIQNFRFIMKIRGFYSEFIMRGANTPATRLLLTRYDINPKNDQWEN